jgi:hypothetical protein
MGGGIAGWLTRPSPTYNEKIKREPKVPVNPPLSLSLKSSWLRRGAGNLRFPGHCIFGNRFPGRYRRRILNWNLLARFWPIAIHQIRQHAHCLKNHTSPYALKRENETASFYIPNSSLRMGNHSTSDTRTFGTGWWRSLLASSAQAQAGAYNSIPVILASSLLHREIIY